MARSAPKKLKKNRKPSGLPWRLAWRVLAVGVVLLGLLGGLGLAGIFYYYGQDLPKIMSRKDFKPPQMTRVYAASGELIAELSAPEGGRRTVVALEKIPNTVRWSFMAAEDADFMNHKGIDYLGMVRAFYYAVFYGTGLKGTSTITQQVVKNLLLTPEKKLERKIQEIILSRELEQELTKDDILWLYLNEVYMGHGVNGVEEAAKLYFSKSVTDLTLTEAATLAGINQSPERLSPLKYPDRALKRRAFVLRQLWEKGFIEEAVYREADKTPLTLNPSRLTKKYIHSAPHFTELIRQQLIERYGKEKVYGGGLRVTTTLDLEKQIHAQDALRQALRAYDKRHKVFEPVRHLTGAKLKAWRQNQTPPATPNPRTLLQAVVLQAHDQALSLTVGFGSHEVEVPLEPAERVLWGKKGALKPSQKYKKGDILQVRFVGTGPDAAPLLTLDPGPEAGFVMIDPGSRDVVAMVGGYDFGQNQYNHTLAMRQPGSTFKPFVYAAALEAKKITPATLFLDTPKTFEMGGGKTYTPKNSDGQSRGEIRIREALGASRNAVAVRLLDLIGIEAGKAFAKKVGIQSPLDDSITLVMGSSSVTLLELTNAYATFATGGVFAPPRMIQKVEAASGSLEPYQTKGKPVLSPEVAYLIGDLLQAPTQGYTDARGTRRRGTASGVDKLANGMAIAGKTGTTNEAKDALFVGYTPYYVAGAWVGYDDNRPLGGKESGGVTAAPIWIEAMAPAHKGLKPRKFEKPASGLISVAIDPATGKLVQTGGILETFLMGTAPTEYVEQGTKESEDFLLEQLGQ